MGYTLEDVKEKLPNIRERIKEGEAPIDAFKNEGIPREDYLRWRAEHGKQGQRLWIVDNAVAYVESGNVTLQIDEPTRDLPRNEAFQVADKIWFANQMRELEIARQRGETKTIPLTDRRRRSSLRLGGGFMLTQGTKLILPRRTMDAPRPGQFCECAGVFEHVEGGEEKGLAKDYIASLLKESQEILIAHGNTLYVPQLAQYPAVQVGFQPPSRLDNYNKIILDEVRRELTKFRELRPGDFPDWLSNEKNWRMFWMKLLDYERSVRLQFGYSPEISVEITAEIDSSSLECVGVLSLPGDIYKAVEAYERGNTPKDEWESKKMKLGLPKDRALEYWDIEEGKPETFRDPETDRKFDVAAPAHRDVYLIDLERCHEEGGIAVWHFEGKGKRKERPSSLWIELSDTCIGAESAKEEKDKGEKGKPGGTGGRFATEKVEKAIKMHCPYHRLQPLVRL